MAFKFGLFILNPYWNFNETVALGAEEGFFCCFQIQDYPKQKSSLLLWQLQI